MCGRGKKLVGCREGGVGRAEGWRQASRHAKEGPDEKGMGGHCHAMPCRQRQHNLPHLPASSPACLPAPVFPFYPACPCPLPASRMAGGRRMPCLPIHKSRQACVRVPVCVMQCGARMLQNEMDEEGEGFYMKQDIIVIVGSSTGQRTQEVYTGGEVSSFLRVCTAM